ncbi:MAG: polyhydroxyalkanoate synthesis repressor PhaR [Pseudomonadota bacterium]|nr:polyhydroxyalkanoate synthesis repressor PhaR [Pseudomonadota bacterium]
MAKEVESNVEPVVIKKYANRRLYNTETSAYVTLDDLAEMVRLERDFVVYDAKTGEELTRSVLTQIIVEQESRGTNLLPVNFLRQLIRFYGAGFEALVPKYLEVSLDSLTRQQERYRKQFADTFGASTLGASAMGAIEEHARQNIAIFERAMGMFGPFGAGRSQKASSAPSDQPSAASPQQGSDIETLKAELTAMQEKLEKLSTKSG